ncbi:MAG: hypothetical protein HQP61_11700, partial [Peptococcaceae bacterium]|nr:hypothetical protein [Candidatus Syntrophopropionicum ammoniitolerans]
MSCTGGRHGYMDLNTRGQQRILQDIRRELLKELAAIRGREGRAGSITNPPRHNLPGKEQYKGFFYGIGAAMLTSMLWPVARQRLRSLALVLIENGMVLSDKVRLVMCRAGEEIEDIVAEARFKSLQKESY